MALPRALAARRFASLASSPSSSSSSSSALPFLSPAVSHLVHLHGLDPTQIQPTGPKRRILKGDVLLYLSQSPPTKARSPRPWPSSPSPSPSPSPSSLKPASPSSSKVGFTDRTTSAQLRDLGARYVEGKSRVPQHSLTIDVDMGAAEELLRSVGVAAGPRGSSLALRDLVVRAAIASLSLNPEANAVWDEQSQEPRSLGRVNVTVATHTPEGPRFSLLKNAASLGLLDISSVLQEAIKAPAAPESVESFCVFDYGSSGVWNAREILSGAGSSGVLSMSSVRREPRVGSEGRLTFSPQASLTLTADARVFHPHLAQTFLASLARFLETPRLLS